MAANTHFAFPLGIFEEHKPTGLKRRLLYIFFWLVVALPLAAQSPKRYSFTHYGVPAGLASNETYTSVQDDEGYMWIAGTNGLQRFDGLRFLTFTHRKNDPGSLPGNVVGQLVVDKKRRLWLQIDGLHFGIFDTKNFTFREFSIRPTKEEYKRNNKKLVTDEEGNMMLVLGNAELLTLNEEKGEFAFDYNFVKYPAGWKVVDIYNQPGTKKYWLGTLEGMVMYNRETNQVNYKDHNPGREPMIDRWGSLSTTVNFMLDKQKRLWFDLWNGAPEIYCYDLANNEPVLTAHSLLQQLKAYHELRGFMQQRNGTIWVNGLNVFAQYLEKEKQFQLVYNGYENEQSISFTIAYDIVEDREQNLWVTTNNNGVYRFNPSAQFFTNIHQLNRVLNRPGDGSMMSFALTRKGTLLAGSWGDGLYNFDSNFNMIPLNIRGFDEKMTPSMWSMFESKDSNTIWMGVQPGIHKVDQARGTTTVYNVGAIKDRTVRQVAEDRFGNLWMGVRNRLYKWNAEKGKKQFEDGISLFNDVPADATVIKITIDSRGYIWICTSTSGLFVIDPATDKVMLHFGMKEPPERKLLWDGVASVIRYNDSTMVIAAQGFYLFDTRKQKIVKTIPMPSSVPGIIQAMEKDKNGYVWISMTSGIFRFNPVNEIFIHFDRVDGIANDYFIAAASYVLPDGRIIFGADNQFVVFDPMQVKINDPAPDVTITGFQLMNKSLRLDSLLSRNRVELGPDDNSIAIEFSGLSYNGTYIMKYKLENLDKDWVVADKSNMAIYSFLPPGTYTFMAYSEDAEGKPSRNVVKMVIQVRPPFWKTWWFLGLVIFAATTVLFWLDKIRMHRLRAMESVRTRIATSLTEDMSNSLTNINISSELAKTKIDMDVQRTKEYIKQISETSNRMVQSMYDMVWSIDPKNDTMSNTIERMKIYAAETENNYPININFDIDRQVEKLGLDMEHRYELLCIYKEAVTNAGKHSGGRHIKVSIRYNKANLIMMIIDDGKGFLMTEAAMLGRGISDVRRRASGINAMFYIESEINTGTVVKLEMPV